MSCPVLPRDHAASVHARVGAGGMAAGHDARACRRAGRGAAASGQDAAGAGRGAAGVRNGAASRPRSWAICRGALPVRDLRQPRAGPDRARDHAALHCGRAAAPGGRPVADRQRPRQPICRACRPRSVAARTPPCARSSRSSRRPGSTWWRRRDRPRSAARGGAADRRLARGGRGGSGGGAGGACRMARDRVRGMRWWRAAVAPWRRRARGPTRCCASLRRRRGGRGLDARPVRSGRSGDRRRGRLAERAGRAAGDGRAASSTSRRDPDRTARRPAGDRPRDRALASRRG